MGNLYCALVPRGGHEVRLVQLEANLQDSLSDHFEIYEQQFYEGVEETIGFDGGYTPDPHQLIHLPLTAEMMQICQQVEAGGIGRDVYNPRADVADDIRALFWHYDAGGISRILVQNFTRAQAVQRRGMLLAFTDHNTFNALDQPAILIENKIHAVMTQGRVEFKRFATLKQVFDLTEVYREATDQDVEEFLASPNINSGDADLIGKLNATQRKLIFSIGRSDTINRVPVQDLLDRAADVGLALPVQAGRIELPSGPELTKILKFLDNSVYKSPVDEFVYVANSRRRLG